VDGQAARERAELAAHVAFEPADRERLDRGGLQKAAFVRAAQEGLVGSAKTARGLFEVGDGAPQAPRGATGLYHLAWEVPTLQDLATARETLANLGALTGQSDHGATKSLYAVDPDGNEFEVMWMVPREQWGEFDRRAITAPLNLERELATRA
jgi:catechol-2,3-dioxygenase